MKPSIIFTAYFFSSALGLLTFTQSVAQETPVNSQIGISLRDNYKLSDDWRIIGSQTVFFSKKLQLSSDDSTAEPKDTDSKSSFLNNYYSLSSILLMYRFNKEVKAGAGYQLHLRSRGALHRMTGNVYYTNRLSSSWRLYNRFRYQKEWLKGRKGFYSRDYIRIRSRIQYRAIKYVRPYADTELTFRLNQDRRRFDRLRTAIGLDFRMKRHVLRLEYNYQIRPYREDAQPSPGLIIRGFFRI